MVKKFILFLREVRCASCGRLLGKFTGKGEVKCPKCNTVNNFIV